MNCASGPCVIGVKHASFRCIETFSKNGEAPFFLANAGSCWVQALSRLTKAPRIHGCFAWSGDSPRSRESRLSGTLADAPTLNERGHLPCFWLAQMGVHREAKNLRSDSFSSRQPVGSDKESALVGGLEVHGNGIVNQSSNAVGVEPVL